MLLTELEVTGQTLVDYSLRLLRQLSRGIKALNSHRNSIFYKQILQVFTLNPEWYHRTVIQSAYATLRTIKEALGLEHEDDLVDDAANGLLRNIDGKISLGRRLIGVVDTSETLDLAAAGLGVDTALVGLLAVLEGSSNMDQEEVAASLGNSVTGGVAGLLVGSNRGGNDGGTGAG